MAWVWKLVGGFPHLILTASDYTRQRNLLGGKLDESERRIYGHRVRRIQDGRRADGLKRGVLANLSI